MINLSYFRQNSLSMLRFLFVIHVLLTFGLLSLFFPPTMRWYNTVVGPLWAYTIFALSLLYLLLYLPLLKLVPGRSYRLVLGLEAARYLILTVDLLLFRKMGVHLFSSFVVKSLLEFKLGRAMGIGVTTILMIVVIVVGSFLMMWLTVWLWYLASSRHLFLRTGQVTFSLVRGFFRLSSVVLGKLFSWRVKNVRFVEVLFWLTVVPTVGFFYVHASKVTQRKFSEYVPLYTHLNFWSSFRQESLARKIHLKKRFQYLRYPRKKVADGDLKAVKRPNLILFSAESLRSDMLNKKDMPLLSSWLQKQPTILSKAHYSGGHQTWEGYFSMMYSLYGHHRDTFRHKTVRPYTLRLLKKLGYRLVAATASNYDFDGFAATMKPFDRIVNLENMKTIAADAKLHHIVMEELKKQKSKPAHKRQPLFFLVFYMSTHYPFTFPKRHATFRPFLPPRTNHVVLPADHQQKLWNRYRNSVRYLDELMTKTLTSLYKELPDEQLAWAFVGDHGEEFWDHGLFGHGARRLNNARVQTPFVLRVPGMKRTKTIPLSSHVDIFPTWFSAMGLPLKPSDYSDGVDLMKTTRRSVFVNGYNFPDSPIFVIATPGKKLFVRRDEKMKMELNQVLDADDRKVHWNLNQYRALLHQHRRAIDWFYPGYQLFRSNRLVKRIISGYPFPSNYGPIRSASRPELLPWQRMGDLSRFVTRKAPKVQVKLGIKLGEIAELVGYNLRTSNVRLGDPVVLELVYRCLKKPSRSWRIFHHFKFKQKPGFKNVSEVPALGRYPVWRWKPGEYIRDPHRIATHPNWHTGTGEIRMGLWNRSTRKRAVITSPLSRGNSVLVTKLKLTR